MIYQKLYGVTTKYPKKKTIDKTVHHSITDLPTVEPIDYGYIRELNDDFIEFYDKSFYARGGVVGLGLIGIFFSLMPLTYIIPGLFTNFLEDGFFILLSLVFIIISCCLFFIWFLGGKNFISFREFPIRFNRTLQKVYFLKNKNEKFAVDWKDLVVKIEIINVKSEFDFYEIKFQSHECIEQPFYMVRKVSSEDDLLKFSSCWQLVVNYMDGDQYKESVNQNYYSKVWGIFKKSWYSLFDNDYVFKENDKSSNYTYVVDEHGSLKRNKIIDYARSFFIFYYFISLLGNLFIHLFNRNYFFNVDSANNKVNEGVSLNTTKFGFTHYLICILCAYIGLLCFTAFIEFIMQTRGRGFDNYLKFWKFF